MAKNRNEFQNSDTHQEVLMNRVNQTFDKMTEDVKNMVGENEKRKNNK
ncbi:hypothetical protein J7I93_19680 [Bacillus sp. ISL-47]|nr:hypothetical protein [Bacillus sp. ISL-47]MBT2690377.1 hypothetical protein [Bacillus sp. ISL-47]MBT2709173.1 hypothetical protein [Pseudomonas sp. ISL-84]